MTLLAPEDLHLYFRYDAESGNLYWLNSGPGRRPSLLAGCSSPDGYRLVMLNKVLYKEHRVIWAMLHGRWPEEHIDHVNGKRDDNRIENLREATNAQNMSNRGKQANNTSGHKGVCWDKSRNKWTVNIAVNGKDKHLGRHDDLEFAAFVYEEAARKYHGEYSNA